ncbi:hypothetical protein [Gardnerella sp. KA00747]|uniref:hypothetical protein n=1 Tax=Gardnerella sp. KA00747 TaxID=2749078 RepID=UPI003BAAA06D
MNVKEKTKSGPKTTIPLQLCKETVGTISGKCSIITQIQQQMPENLPQMFHKTANTATNAGVFPANVPKNGQRSYKSRSFSGKCSKKPPKQQHLPEKKLPQMFL